MPKLRVKLGIQDARSKKTTWGLSSSKCSLKSISVRSMAVIRSEPKEMGTSEVVSASGGRPSTRGMVIGMKVIKCG